MVPAELQVILDAAAPKDSRAIREAVAKFINDKIIEPDPEDPGPDVKLFRLTARGQEWLKEILATPMPDDK